MHDHRSVIREHMQNYPHMELQDLYKLLYQSIFGAGHLVRDGVYSLERIETELQQVGAQTGASTLIEPIGNGYCRVHLAALAENNISPQSLNRVFVHCANEQSGTLAAFCDALDQVDTLCEAGQLPFQKEQLEAYRKQYAAAGYPMLSHSKRYHACHAPAYRVMPVYAAKQLKIVSMTDRRSKNDPYFVLAIDGSCGAGKTTLSRFLQALYDCPVVPMDAFFLPQALRTEERLCTPGGNIHVERFLEEVGTGILSRKAFSYAPFNCSTMQLDAPITVPDWRILLVEGSYSMHTALRHLYGGSVFLEVSSQEQWRRISRRETPGQADRFVREWIPMEQAYFSAQRTRQACDLVVCEE